MTVLIASQLVGFILGGGIFLLRYDHPDILADR
jgi:ligand-binding sensor protein